MRKIIVYLLVAGAAIWLQAAAQNVGIGTNTPTKAKLEVYGVFTGGATAGLFGSDNAGISLQRNFPTIGFNQYRDNITPGTYGKYMANGFAAIEYFDPGTGTLAIDMFSSGNANSNTPVGVRAITIASNGNTSIRGTNTNATLVVARGDGAEGTAVFQGPTHSSHFNYSLTEDTYIRAGLNNGTVYINKIPSGSILIGTTATRIGINNPGVNPFYTIEINQPSGQKAFSLVDIYNNKWSMACNFINTLNNGTGVALDFYYNNSGRGRFQYWDGNYGAFSDREVKEDIKEMETVLEKIKNLRTVRYEMIRNNPDHQKTIGMLAQEVLPVFPQLVRKVSDHYPKEPISDALVMNYSGFGVIAIKALQEQAEQLEKLEKEKRELVARLMVLEKLLGEK
jgi:hypothetical protein